MEKVIQTRNQKSVLVSFCTFTLDHVYFLVFYRNMICVYTPFSFNATQKLLQKQELVNYTHMIKTTEINIYINTCLFLALLEFLFCTWHFLIYPQGSLTPLWLKCWTHWAIFSSRLKNVQMTSVFVFCFFYFCLVVSTNSMSCPFLLPF